jgi:UDP-glucose 4-epimerase
MSTFLVTGAAGFIGLNQCEYLLNLGHRVVGVDNYITSYLPICNPVINEFEYGDNFIFHECDLSNIRLTEYQEDLDSLFKYHKFDYIIHLAAIPSVQRSIDYPRSVLENNFMSTMNILELSRKYNIKKFVYASSSSYYGGIYYIGQPLNNRAPHCKSPYAASKGAGELLVNSYFHSFHLPTTILRYFNVFGKYQNPKSQYSAVIPIFINKILNDEQPIIYGDGKQSRDFTHIDNVVYANYLAAISDTKGNILDIGCGLDTSLIELIQMINTVIGKNISPIFDAPRYGDVSFSLSYIKRAYDEIKYQVQTSLSKGLEKTIEYYKNMKEEKNERRKS